MKKYGFISLGSFIGAVLRYLIKNIQIFNYQGNIPLDTLAINVSGTFMLAFILTISFKIWKFNPDIKLGITIGLLGAFTTFSSLCKEIVILINNGDYLSAIIYTTLSVILGLAFAYLGVSLARKAGSKIIKKQEKEEKIIAAESDVI